MNLWFVKTPRYIWPFNSETSAFWQPLGFAGMAAVLRERMPDLDVRIVDCPALKTGWRSLEGLLRSGAPDILCIGEETVSAHEAIRLARLVKEIRSDTTVIAGGCYFAYAVEDTLLNHPVDFIVRSEGEETLLDLLRELRRKDPDPAGVRGIAYRDGGEIRQTPPRPLIADLNALPIPAYDMLPMDRYGRGSRNHPNLAAIEHSRGCIDTCNFCILWRHMGDETNGACRPRLRTKSGARSFEEARLLVERYDRRTLGWVDPSWNADPEWSDEFCALMIRNHMQVMASAWMRADCIVRDERLGILRKQVKAGLRRAIIGVERVRDDDLRSFGKHNNAADVTAEAFAILRRNYPEVDTIGTFIYGVWEETEESIAELLAHAAACRMDYSFFIPATPNPGTPLHQEAVRRNAIEVDDFRAYNFITPVMRSRDLTAAQLQDIFHKHAALWWLRDSARGVRDLFCERDPRKRGVRRALFRHGLRVFNSALWNRFTRRNGNPALHWLVPAWYNS
ncbi:MAG: cobalamin-dependent protein [Planctomycetota bacterium]